MYTFTRVEGDDLGQQQAAPDLKKVKRLLLPYGWSLRYISRFFLGCAHTSAEAFETFGQKTNQHGQGGF